MGYPSSQFKNYYFTEICSGSEEDSYLRLIDFVYHSTLGLRVIKKRGFGCGVDLHVVPPQSLLLHLEGLGFRARLHATISTAIVLGR